ncbi:MAG: hypothetical protein QM725_05680 [Lacibacter sp.]
MARQSATYLSGKIGNLIFYTRNGGNFAKQAPVTVHQTNATKASARSFGKSSTLGKNFRRLLLPVIPFPQDREMQCRFAGAFTKWLTLNNNNPQPPQTNLPFITGFAFNAATSIAERCKLPFTVSSPLPNISEVQLPGFIPANVFTAPAHTAAIQLTITVAACSLHNAEAVAADTKQLHIVYDNNLVPAQTLQFNVAANAGTLLLTAVQIVYILQNGKTEERNVFMPAGVVDGRCV